MIRKACSRLAVMLVISIAAPALGQQYYLYTPQKVEQGEASATEGVLVKEVVVRKGDCLSKISKRATGKGYYYPQILLFNEIKNPHRIQIGDVVRVPVKKMAKHEGKAGKPAKGRKSEVRETAPVAERKQESGRNGMSAASSPVRSNDPGQKLYDRAYQAYQKGECRSAIELFDSFLKSHPSSSLAADADLYKADCFLKLSSN